MSIPLFCLGGSAAPPGIAADLCVLARLPERARARCWDALGPALPEPLPAPAERALESFARTLEIDGDDLGRALKACRFLVREASARGLDPARFEDDVVRLAGGPRSPEAAVIAPILLSHYKAASSAVRSAFVAETMEDHGAVLESVEWRVDSVVSSSRGDALDARITLITLGYHEGARKERLTLRVPPDKLEELRRACERMAQGGGRVP